MTWTFPALRRSTALFTCIAAAILLLTGFAFWELQRGRTGAERLLETHAQELLLIERLGSATQLKARSARGYLLTNDPAYLPEITAAQDIVAELSNDLRQALQSAEGQALYQQFTEAQAHNAAIIDSMVAQRRAGAPVETAAGTFRAVAEPSREAVDEALRDLVRFASAQLATQRLAVTQRQGLAMQLVTALALLGLLLAVVDGVLAGRSLRHERHARRAEQRTREDKQFLDTMLDSLQAGIIASNGDGQLTLLNRATREFHGLPAASIPLSEWDQYCTVYEADGATPLPEERIPIVRALRGEHVDDQEIVVAPRTGAARTLLASGRVIVDAEGEQLGAVVAMLDITSRRTAERELAAKAAELERSNAELERFAYVASHDLQEPLRMVSSYTQLLARRYTGRLDDNADEFIRYAVNGATRMQRLINDLLVYSRVSSRARQATPTDSGRAVATALSNLSRAIEDTGAEVDVGPLPEVLVDGSQLVQVFQNLIGNAIKFHSPGNRPIIRIGALRQDGMWQISVHDNGLGIDPAYFDRIFILFQRLHTRDTYSGTGIGLAICKKIVERHGGRIWVDSAEGRGATFTFTLPGATDGQDESATAHDH